MQYPNSDDVPYHEWFGPNFTSIFIGLNPFIQVERKGLWSYGNRVPSEVLNHAKRTGLTSSLTWAEVASLCGFSSLADVNQALRLTGSKRLVEKYASAQNTATLLKRCEEHRIYPPDEGYASPHFELQLAAFLRALGLKQVSVGDSFGSCEDPLESMRLLDPDHLNEFSQFASSDRSFYAVIYTDYHYWLICQTAESLASAKPDAFFEGFYATPKTNDFWGLPISIPVQE